MRICAIKEEEEENAIVKSQLQLIQPERVDLCQLLSCHIHATSIDTEQRKKWVLRVSPLLKLPTSVGPSSKAGDMNIASIWQPKDQENWGKDEQCVGVFRVAIHPSSQKVQPIIYSTNRWLTSTTAGLIKKVLALLQQLNGVFGRDENLSSPWMWYINYWVWRTALLLLLLLLLRWVFLSAVFLLQDWKPT